MAFSCKVILADYQKSDGKKQVYLQAIIERKRAIVPVGFYVDAKDFDSRAQSVRSSCSNHKDYNIEIGIALTKANRIASHFRIKEKILSVDTFKSEFLKQERHGDFHQFIANKIEHVRPLLAKGTVVQHEMALRKMQRFKKPITFSDWDHQEIENFKTFLIKKCGNSLPTINKTLKIIKHYTLLAMREKKIEENPFESIKIREFKSNRVALSQKELIKLNDYYTSENCKPTHKKILRYFLFSCFTGLRISDIKSLKWENISNDLETLSYIPQKTKFKNKIVVVPIGFEREYIPKKENSNFVFAPFAPQVVNRNLKQIAQILGINKRVSYHTSRHTFGTLMAETGHLAETQKMMGHESIKTSMAYVHTSHKNLISAKSKMFVLPIK